MTAHLPETDSPRIPALRIAVILGTGSSGQDLLERVQPLLGNERDVEMQGVFIEEAELQCAAELPFVQELCRVTFNVREFTSDQFERALALRMRSARQALDHLARRAGIRHSFHSVRGTALSLLRETAENSDITVFESGRRINAGRVDSDRYRSIVAVVTDEASTVGVIRAAQKLTSGRMERLSVVAYPRHGESVVNLEQEVLDQLHGRPVQARMAGGSNAAALAEVVRKLGAAMVVLPVSPELMESAELGDLRDKLECPICLVRRW